MQMKNRSHGSHRYDINRPWTQIWYISKVSQYNDA